MKNTDTPSIERLKDALTAWGRYDPDISLVRVADLAKELAAAAHAALETLPSAGEGVERPIPMLLYCPKCGLKHVDEPDARTPDWTNPPHRSHLCHGCGCIWRPADVPTNGVERIETRGKADTFHVEPFAITPSPPLEQPDIEGRARELAERVCRDVAELPDRTSPDDWPEAMLVTGEELHGIVSEVVVEVLSLPTTEIRREALEEAQIETLAREAMFDTEFARTGVVNPVNGTAAYSYVTFHGQRVTFHDGEFTIEMHRDAGTGQAAAYAAKINDALFDLAKRAVAAALASPPSRPSFDKWDYAAAALADARCAK